MRRLFKLVFGVVKYFTQPPHTRSLNLGATVNVNVLMLRHGLDICKLRFVETWVDISKLRVVEALIDVCKLLVFVTWIDICKLLVGTYIGICKLVDRHLQTSYL